MKYQIPLEITVNNNILSINFDIKELSKIVNLVLSSTVVDNKKSIHSEITNLSNKISENDELEDTSNESLEDVLLNFLKGLRKTKDGWDLWELKKRSVYNTIRCNVRQSTSGKSAIYYYVGRDKQLSISIHNSIIDSFVINLLAIDESLEICGTGDSYFYYIDQNDFPLYNEKLMKYVAPKESIKYKFESILEYIDRTESIRSCFFLNENSITNTVILPPVLNLNFYEFFSMLINNNESYHEDENPPTSIVTLQQKLENLSSIAFSDLQENEEKITYINYSEFLKELVTEKVAFVVDNEKRFSGTKRMVFTEKYSLIDFLQNIKYKLEDFLETNGTFL